MVTVKSTSAVEWKALVWSLVHKACGDTTGLEREMLSGTETDKLWESKIDAQKTITSLVAQC